MDDEEPACVGVMQPGQPTAVLMGLVPAFRPSHILHINVAVVAVVAERVEARVEEMVVAVAT
jgi:hypothetical protein